jgi:hypothetical protein
VPTTAASRSSSRGSPRPRGRQPHPPARVFRPRRHSRVLGDWALDPLPGPGAPRSAPPLPTAWWPGASLRTKEAVPNHDPAAGVGGRSTHDVAIRAFLRSPKCARRDRVRDRAALTPNVRGHRPPIRGEASTMPKFRRRRSAPRFPPPGGLRGHRQRLLGHPRPTGRRQHVTGHHPPRPAPPRRRQPFWGRAVGQRAGTAVVGGGGHGRGPDESHSLPARRCSLPRHMHVPPVVTDPFRRPSVIRPILIARKEGLPRPSGREAVRPARASEHHQRRTEGRTSPFCVVSRPASPWCLPWR